jgi:hypothetical protein
MRARSERCRQQMAAGALENGGSYPTKGRATQPFQNVSESIRYSQTIISPELRRDRYFRVSEPSM